MEDELFDDAPRLYHWEDGRSKHELHMSHILTYLKCPQQLYRKYIKCDTESRGYSANLATGQVQHKFLKEQLRKKARGEEVMDDEQSCDFISDTMEDEADQLDLSQREEFVQSKDRLIDMGMLLQHKYIPVTDPMFVEQPYEIKIQGVRYKLAGQIDHVRKLRTGSLIDPNGNSYNEQVIPNKKFGVDDLKTSAKTPSKSENGLGYKPDPGHVLQQTAYSLGAWIALGNKPGAYQQTANSTVYIVKNKVPVLRPANYIIGRHEVKFLFDIIKEVSNALTKGVFPKNPTGWWCSNKFCPAYETCKKREVHQLEDLILTQKEEDNE